MESAMWGVEVLVSVLLLAGAGFALVGSIGLARLPDFFMRLHAPTKATTLGVGAMMTDTLSDSLSAIDFWISKGCLLIKAPSRAICSLEILPMRSLR